MDNNGFFKDVFVPANIYFKNTFLVEEKSQPELTNKAKDQQASFQQQIFKFRSQWRSCLSQKYWNEKQIGSNLFYRFGIGAHGQQVVDGGVDRAPVCPEDGLNDVAVHRRKHYLEVGHGLKVCGQVNF